MVEQHAIEHVGGGSIPTPPSISAHAVCPGRVRVHQTVPLLPHPPQSSGFCFFFVHERGSFWCMPIWYGSGKPQMYDGAVRARQPKRLSRTATPRTVR